MTSEGVEGGMRQHLNTRERADDEQDERVTSANTQSVSQSVTVTRLL